MNRRRFFVALSSTFAALRLGLAAKTPIAVGVTSPKPLVLLPETKLYSVGDTLRLSDLANRVILVSYELIDVTDCSSGFEEYIPGPLHVSFCVTVNGVTSMIRATGSAECLTVY